MQLNKYFYDLPFNLLHNTFNPFIFWEHRSDSIHTTIAIGTLCAYYNLFLKQSSENFFMIDLNFIFLPKCVHIFFSFGHDNWRYLTRQGEKNHLSKREALKSTCFRTLELSGVTSTEKKSLSFSVNATRLILASISHSQKDIKILLWWKNTQISYIHLCTSVRVTNNFRKLYAILISFFQKWLKGRKRCARLMLFELLEGIFRKAHKNYNMKNVGSSSIARKKSLPFFFGGCH